METPGTSDLHADLPVPTTSASPPKEPPFFRTKPATLLVRGGVVHTGRGGSGTRADVVVDDGFITWIGEVRADQPADRTLDATGLVVAPGFIDLHSHTDPEGSLNHLLAMGVTTIVLGQDGESPKEGVAGFLRSYKRGAGVNVSTLAGHSTLRKQALALEPNNAMRRRAHLAELVTSALAEGALGLSFGLEYDGARGTDQDELLACLAPLGAEKRVAMAHLRSEDDEAIEGSISEFIGACKGAGAHAHIAHLKVVLGKGEARAEEILNLLEKARDRKSVV